MHEYLYRRTHTNTHTLASGYSTLVLKTKLNIFHVHCLLPLASQKMTEYNIYIMIFTTMKQQKIKQANIQIYINLLSTKYDFVKMTSNNVQYSPHFPNQKIYLCRYCTLVQMEVRHTFFFIITLTKESHS